MATDRADVVCAPNGQAPINRCSAKLDFGGHQSRKGLFVAQAHSDAQANAGIGRATVCTVSLIFLTKIGFIP